MKKFKNALSNWKIHLLALIFTIIAEWIGTKIFPVGPGVLVLVPLLYSFIFGALSGMPRLKILDRHDMVQASSLVGITFFLLMARYGTLVGPNFWKVVEVGPALILQELGNIGTVFLGIPLAIMLGLRREAVGAAFSNAREPNLAIISEKYGLDTPEGRGVMGVYVTGTVFGAIFCSLLASFVASTMSFFSPQALAMATGTGSAGMMTAGLAPLLEIYPDIKGELTALAAASNMLSGLDGVYICVFLSLPLANRLVRFMGVNDAPSVPIINMNKSVNMSKARVQSEGLNTVQMSLFLLICSAQILLANWIGYKKGVELIFSLGTSASINAFASAIPGMIILLGIIAVGVIVHRLMPWKGLPAVAYIVTFGCIVTIPGFPGAEFFNVWTAKVNFLGLCTPILAYAGMAIGKDMEVFKTQGWKIVVVGLVVFVGTFMGSAVIAELVLRYIL